MSATDIESPVVGELGLAVLRPAVLSKGLGELRFLFSTLLAGSCGFWCSCALIRYRKVRTASRTPL